MMEDAFSPWDVAKGQGPSDSMGQDVLLINVQRTVPLSVGAAGPEPATGCFLDPAPEAGLDFLRWACDWLSSLFRFHRTIGVRMPDLFGTRSGVRFLFNNWLSGQQSLNRYAI